MSACRLHFEQSGPADAPVIVMAGSLGTDLSMWDPQAEALSHRFRVIRCDLRGHGRSPAPSGPYSIGDLGGDLLNLFDRLGLEHATLCGLSIGAMASLWAAAEAPQRVERLIACCTTAHFATAARGLYRERALRVRRDGLEPLADGVLARWLTPDFARARPDVVAHLRAGLVATPPEGYAACCEALAEADLRPRLRSIRCPVLVLSGEADTATPPEHGRDIAAAIAGAEFDLVAGAAHLASVERAELLTALILRFLAPEEDRHEQ